MSFIDNHRLDYPGLGDFEKHPRGIVQVKIRIRFCGNVNFGIIQKLCLLQEISSKFWARQFLAQAVRPWTAIHSKSPTCGFESGPHAPFRHFDMTVRNAVPRADATTLESMPEIREQYTCEAMQSFIHRSDPTRSRVSVEVASVRGKKKGPSIHTPPNC